MNTRLSRAGIVLVIMAVLAGSTAPASDAGDEIRVIVNPPKDGANGKLTIVFPKAKLLEAVRKAIPESVPLPDQKLGNQLIYREVQMNNLTAENLKPASLSFDAGVFRVAGTPTIKGNLNAMYEHVVITTEVRTIAKIGDREIKQAVPVTRSDWRPKGAAPFAIKLELRGTCRLSFAGNGTLKDQRLRFDTEADYVRIAAVDLKSDEPLYRIARGVIGTAGNAFPNELLNKPIKDSLTRSFEIDPFQGLPQKDREQLARFDVRQVAITSTDSEVTVIAGLVAH